MRNLVVSLDWVGWMLAAGHGPCRCICYMQYNEGFGWKTMYERSSKPEG